jgi:hypothetical protein
MVSAVTSTHLRLYLAPCSKSRTVWHFSAVADMQLLKLLAVLQLLTTCQGSQGQLPAGCLHSGDLDYASASSLLPMSPRSEPCEGVKAVLPPPAEVLHEVAALARATN